MTWREEGNLRPGLSRRDRGQKEVRLIRSGKVRDDLEREQKELRLSLRDHVRNDLDRGQKEVKWTWRVIRNADLERGPERGQAELERSGER